MLAFFFYRDSVFCREFIFCRARENYTFCGYVKKCKIREKRIRINLAAIKKPTPILQKSKKRTLRIRSVLDKAMIDYFAESSR